MRSAGKPAFCVIDVGTGGIKCLVFDAKGSLAFKESSPINFLHEGYAIGFDPAAVWADICRMTRRAKKECTKKKLQIVTVSSTSMREGNVFYDVHGNELLAVPNLDARAYMESVEIQESIGDAIYLSSGHWSSPIFLASRLKFLMKNNPNLFNKIRKVSMINDWVLFKFSGKIVSEPTNGCETALFDLKRRNWNDELIRECDFDRTLFPEIRECGSIIGSVVKEAGRRSGLNESTSVIVGAADTESAVAGCGLFDEGNVAAIAGTTTPIQAVTENPVLDPEKRTWTCCHVLPGRWTLESNAGATGLVFKWWAKMTGEDFSVLDNEVKKEKPAFGKVSVRIGTSLMNARHPHPIVGTIQGVSPWTPRAEVTLGILETNCYSVRANLEQIENVLGKRFVELYFCGGASKSEVWRQLQSNILGRTILTFAVGEATGRGAAMLSAVALKEFANLSEASRSFLRRKMSIKPDGKIFESYEVLYQNWLNSINK